MSLLHHIRSLHTLSPANKDHVSAWRMAISVAVPSLALLAAGRPGLAGYAVFGALTGMYGRTEPHQLRLRHQGQAAVLLVAGVGVGVFDGWGGGPFLSATAMAANNDAADG